MAESWLQSALASGTRILIPHEVALACIRLLANPHVVPRPVMPEVAYTTLAPLLSRPEVRLLAPDEESWRRFGALLPGRQGFRIVHDTHLAALALANDARLVTFDRDLLRFSNLEVELLTL